LRFPKKKKREKNKEKERKKERKKEKIKKIKKGDCCSFCFQ